MAMSQEHGSTLQEVQQFMKKNQVRKSNQPTYSIKVTDTNIHVYFFMYFLLLAKSKTRFPFLILTRHFRGSYRATKARLKMSWREQESSHLFAAQRETVFGQATISWPSYGVFSGWKLKGGSWCLMPCTRLSSTSLTQPKWRPG